MSEWFSGHWVCGPVTVYGKNAMHWAMNIHTRYGYLCLHPTVKLWGQWWPWYAYLSPNATPWAATWGVGPGLDEPRRNIQWRREALGHGFAANDLDYEEMQPPTSKGTQP